MVGHDCTAGKHLPTDELVSETKDENNLQTIHSIVVLVYLDTRAIWNLLISLGYCCIQWSAGNKLPAEG